MDISNDLYEFAEKFESHYTTIANPPHPELAGLVFRIKSEICTAEDLEFIQEVCCAKDSSAPDYQQFYNLYVLVSSIRAKVLQSTKALTSRQADPKTINFVAGLPPQLGNTSYADLSRNIQKDVKSFFQKEILPIAQDEKISPEIKLEQLLLIFQMTCNRNEGVVQGVFTDFSSPGRYLLPPQHLIGHALLLFYRKNDSFPAWIDADFGQQKRLHSLIENVRGGYASASSSAYLESFEKNYQSKFKTKDLSESFFERVLQRIRLYFGSHSVSPSPQEQTYEEYLNKYSGFLKTEIEKHFCYSTDTFSQKLNEDHFEDFLRQVLLYSPDRLSQIAQLLSQERSLNRSQVFFALCLLEYSEEYLKKQGQDVDGFVTASFGALSDRLSRYISSDQVPERQRLRHTAPRREAYQSSSAHIIPPHNKETRPGKPQETVVMDMEKILSPDKKKETPQNTAEPEAYGMWLKDNAKVFVTKTLTPFIQATSDLYTVDPSKGIELIGQGGSSIVVKVYDTTFQQYICWRIDLSSLLFQPPEELFYRSNWIQEQLSRIIGVASSLGFDTIPLKDVSFTSGGRTKTISTDLHFQRIAFIEGSYTLSGIIDILSTYSIVPGPYAIAVFVYKILSTLKYCHGLGCVHRDIKPDNIMIAPPPRWYVNFEKISSAEEASKKLNELLLKGQPMLIDFGIAGFTPEKKQKMQKNRTLREKAPATFTTEDCFLLGTPPFVSPNSCKNVKDTQLTSSDVWALAITLYELLTGQSTTHPTEYSYQQRGFYKKSGLEMAQILKCLANKKNLVVSPDDPLLVRFQEQASDLDGYDFSKDDKYLRFSQVIVKWIAQMTHPDPAERPSMENLVKFFECPVYANTVEGWKERRSRAT